LEINPPTHTLLSPLPSDGAIKIEINGGGVNANYSASSGVNRVEVEIDGSNAPLTGYLGTVGASSGRNRIDVRSEKDSVQLSLLPSPL